MGKHTICKRARHIDQIGTKRTEVHTASYRHLPLLRAHGQRNNDGRTEHNSLGTSSTNGKKMMKKTKQFLDYVASHPDAILTFSASNMVLNVHIDASYLTEPKARSRAGGHFFLSDNSKDPTDNGAVLNVAQIIKNVMSSAAEAELGALFINSRQAIPHWHQSTRRRWILLSRETRRQECLQYNNAANK